ncbi:hypothetical protein D3C71_1463470 [compost metagenome]
MAQGEVLDMFGPYFGQAIRCGETFERGDAVHDQTHAAIGLAVQLRNNVIGNLDLAQLARREHHVLLIERLKVNDLGDAAGNLRIARNAAFNGFHPDQDNQDLGEVGNVAHAFQDGRGSAYGELGFVNDDGCLAGGDVADDAGLDLLIAAGVGQLEAVGHFGQQAALGPGFFGAQIDSIGIHRKAVYRLALTQPSRASHKQDGGLTRPALFDGLDGLNEAHIVAILDKGFFHGVISLRLLQVSFSGPVGVPAPTGPFR